MPESRITVPIDDFTQTMRSMFPRYASLSNEQLIELFAAENPQCRLLREGTDVTLENLSSIFAAEAERQAQQAAPKSEPAPAAIPSPEPAHASTESEESRQQDTEPMQTTVASRAIYEDRELAAASDRKPRMFSLEPEEEKKRRILPWVFSVVAALALGASVIYYAQHHTADERNHAPITQVAPAPEAATPAPPATEPASEASAPATASPSTVPPATEPKETAPASPPTLPEKHAEVAPAPAPAEAKADPFDASPALSVDKLFQRFHAGNGEGAFIDKKIRIRAKIEKLAPNGVSFMSQDGPLTYWFDVRGFGEGELKSLQEGEDVEAICAFTGNRVSIGDTEVRWSFHGFKIRKVAR